MGTKIIAYAKMDSTFRPSIREILEELESEQDLEDMIFPEGSFYICTYVYWAYVNLVVTLLLRI